MGCGCKNKKGLTPDSMHLTRSYPGVDETGTIMIQSAPDCIDPYQGPFRKVTVFVVGYGTEHETLFKKSERTAAIKKARSGKLTFDQVVAGSLCDEVAVALLGA